MEKSDEEKIQERHDALPNFVKKGNAFYVKYPTPTNWDQFNAIIK